MNELDYLDQIETNTSYIDNIWSDMDYIKSQNENMIYTLEKIQSGDTAIYQELKNTNVAVYTVAVIFTLYLIMYYVVRCLK